ncbi:MAG: fumarylacetoacetate hydrolase family protein, partial [Acidobacteriota bacterium]
FIVPLDALAPDMLTLVEHSPHALIDARRIVEAGSARLPLAQVRLLAPIPRPRKNIFAIGRNYAEHAQESAAARGEQVTPPIFFTKAPTSVSGPFDSILIDADVSVEVDWEVELAVIVGRRARKITRQEALAYVFGYSVLNDVSARDVQHQTSQFFIGKSIDGYCPMGPWIVTADEIADPQNLALRCRVNGQVKQEGNTRSMLYSIATILEELSRTLTLEPGDIIATGTPAGVGFARKPPEYLKPGDVLESEVEGIGMLRNPVTGV